MPVCLTPTVGDGREKVDSNDDIAAVNHHGPQPLEGLLSTFVSLFHQSLGDRPVRVLRHLERVDHDVDVECSDVGILW